MSGSPLVSRTLAWEIQTFNYFKCKNFIVQVRLESLLVCNVSAPLDIGSSHTQARKGPLALTPLDILDEVHVQVATKKL